MASRAADGAHPVVREAPHTPHRSQLVHPRGTLSRGRRPLQVCPLVCVFVGKKNFSLIRTFVFPRIFHNSKCIQLFLFYLLSTNSSIIIIIDARSEALRSGLLNDDEEVVITAALQIVHALCRLGEASAAALLFSQV